MLELSTTARSVLGSDLPLIDDGVTVEQLLAHRSGIGDYFDEDADREIRITCCRSRCTSWRHRAVPGRARRPPEQVRAGRAVRLLQRRLRRAGADCRAGERRAVPRVGAQRVCGRRGMTDTEFLRSDELPGRTASGYVEVDGEWRTNVLHLPVRGSGDGGIYSTAADIARSGGRSSPGGSSPRSGSPRWCAPVATRRGVEALRARLLAPRVERHRHPGRVRRRSVVPLRARPPHTGDSHGDLEHSRRCVADPAVSRECSLRLSDSPRLV